MTSNERRRAVFWAVVVGALAPALAGYYAFESSLPACGPPRNTFLGQIYWLIPIAFIAAQDGVLAWAGIKTRRSLSLTIGVVVLATVAAVLGGVAIFLYFFAAGNCGE